MSTSHALTKEEVSHVATLARLSVPHEQLEVMRGQLAGVLGHVAKLTAIDVTGVQPMTTPFTQINRLDADVPGPCLELADVLRNAPVVEGRFLAVPKVLVDES